MGQGQLFEASRHDHPMIDGRQTPGEAYRSENVAAVQPLSAHEADHAAEHSGEPAGAARRGRHRSRDRGESAALGAADDQSEELAAAKPSAVVPANAGIHNHRARFGKKVERATRATIQAGGYGPPAFTGATDTVSARLAGSSNTRREQ